MAQYETAVLDRNSKAFGLYNDTTEIVIARKGGMVPRLTVKHDGDVVNAHWVPHFRDTSGAPYDASTMKDKYPVELLYMLAGNFLCAPNFGPPCTAYGVELPAHGDTSEKDWTFERCGEIDNAAYLKSTLDAAPSLKVERYDIIDRHPIHYTAVKVTNKGKSDLRINFAWHNTVGDNPEKSFLERGCIIDLSADIYATPPQGSEFDKTGILQIGAQFNDLSKAPARNGETIDLRVVPGLIGHTDFITGALPNIDLGWSSVVNPRQELVYATFFRGPSDRHHNEIKLWFNNLWLQYGGRNFPPWCDQSGKDVTFCLGTENSVGFFANGLEQALQNPILFGRPTTFEIKTGETKTLYYGTLFTHYSNGSLAQGVAKIEKSDSGLVLVGQGKGKTHKVDADADFIYIAQLVSCLR